MKLGALILLLGLQLSISTLVFSDDDSSCVDNYLDFEEMTFGNNSENRLKLYRAFYPINNHLPYSVIVTYQTVFSNGSRVNISVNHRCPNELVWVWYSSPQYLFYGASVANRDMLLTLNYFEEWIPPHLVLTTPYPCGQHTREFLSLMTSSVSTYICTAIAHNDFLHLYS